MVFTIAFSFAVGLAIGIVFPKAVSVVRGDCYGVCDWRDPTNDSVPGAQSRLALKFDRFDTPKTAKWIHLRIRRGVYTASNETINGIIDEMEVKNDRT